MKKNKILSISVAAYNLGDMIKDNLDSFCNSDVSEYLEIIVTDDGSKDNTAAIVEKYQEKYPNVVKLVKQKNSGAGSTVNSGIKQATGKYFKMVDGDDWVQTKNLTKLVNYLKDNDVDLLLTNYEIYDNEKEEIVGIEKVDLPSNEIMDFSSVCKGLDLQMHKVTFKTKILKENNIKLDNGFYTDVEYLLFPIPYIKKVVYLDLNIYVYRVGRAGQSVSIPSMQKNKDMHSLVLDRLIKFYESNKNKLDESKRSFIAERISRMADVELGILLTFKQDKEIINKIKKLNHYLKTSSNDIYSLYKKAKKVKLIIYSNYALCGLVSKIYINKLK